MLTDQQKKAREGKLTASRVACLMKADEEEIYNLWLEMTGDPAWQPLEDYENIWIVKLGEATEQLNLDWTQREQGLIVRRGEVVQHPKIDWAASTLDGWMMQYVCPIEAKHNNGFEPVQQVIDRYQAQMHWQMLCTVSKQCGISIIRGTKEPEFYLVPMDRAYADEIVRRAKDFMEHVHNLTPPVHREPAVVPVFEATKTIDMSANLAWATFATEWLVLKPHEQKFQKLNKELKALVPDDVKIAHGAGIVCKRNKAGSLSIKAGENNDE